MSDFVFDNGVARVLNPDLFHTWTERSDYLEALAASPDEGVRRTRQLVLDFNVELLRAVSGGRVDEEIDGILERYLTEDYIQHDPNIDDGRAPLAEWFRGGAMGFGAGAPLAVMVDGELAVLLVQLLLPDPTRPGETYDFFMLTSYRVRDGRLAEHWAPWPKTVPPGVTAGPAGS